MRKLILSLFALFACVGSAFAATYDEGAYTHNIEQSRGTPADPVRVYMLVRYPEVGANVASISAGEVLGWDVISDDGVTVNRLAWAGTNTGSTSTDAVAGVAVGTIQTADTANAASSSLGSRNWGYIQTYGYCPVAMVQSTAVAGQALAMNDTLVDAQYALPVAVSGNTRAGAIFGFALDAVSSDGQAEIFIKNR